MGPGKAHWLEGQLRPTCDGIDFQEIVVPGHAEQMKWAGVTSSSSAAPPAIGMAAPFGSMIQVKATLCWTP